MDSLLRAAFPFFVPAVLALAGCSGQPAATSVDPAEFAQYRGEFLLTEEPEDVQTVSEVRTALSGKAAPNVLALLEEEGGEHAEHAGHDDHEGEEHADEEHAEEEADEHPGEAAAEEPPAGELPESMEVAIVGVIGGVPNPMEQTAAEFPFAKGQAMFFLADPEAVAELEEHGHQHAPGEVCVFCEAHAADARELIAVVSFTGNKEELIKIDSRELLDLKERDVVVVTGIAELDGNGVLSVNATGLYVRR
jgi:hypothetical protein